VRGGKNAAQRVHSCVDALAARLPASAPGVAVCTAGAKGSGGLQPSSSQPLPRRPAASSSAVLAVVSRRPRARARRATGAAVTSFGRFGGWSGWRVVACPPALWSLSRAPPAACRLSPFLHHLFRISSRRDGVPRDHRFRPNHRCIARFLRRLQRPISGNSSPASTADVIASRAAGAGGSAAAVTKQPRPERLATPARRAQRGTTCFVRSVAPHVLAHRGPGVYGWSSRCSEAAAPPGRGAGGRRAVKIRSKQRLVCGGHRQYSNGTASANGVAQRHCKKKACAQRSCRPQMSLSEFERFRCQRLKFMCDTWWPIAVRHLAHRST
jgi:hypothetical protein